MQQRIHLHLTPGVANTVAGAAAPVAAGKADTGAVGEGREPQRLCASVRTLCNGVLQRLHVWGTPKYGPQSTTNLIVRTPRHLQVIADVKDPTVLVLGILGFDLWIIQGPAQMPMSC